MQGALAYGVTHPTEKIFLHNNKGIYLMKIPRVGCVVAQRNAPQIN
ncbi:hypothetical protein FDUTEX481_04678 [Tolypothrix sp. PCC 7601]|nr:hypothetical protein FDUTEX481_04678 [Tolypothrix sp. PCC 7601]